MNRIVIEEILSILLILAQDIVTGDKCNIDRHNIFNGILREAMTIKGN